MTGPDGSAELAPGDSYLVGRHSSASVHVDHELVSRRHLELSDTSGTWVARDLGSANGTFVGADRVEHVEIDGPVLLRLGSPVDGPRLTLLPGPATDDARHGSDTVETAPHEPVATIVPPPLRPAELGRPLRLHAAGPGPVTIGRADDNDIVLNDLEASRHHAELLASDDGTFELHDLGSFNGTFVDGRRVTRTTVAAGTAIAIGSRILLLAGDRIEEHSAQEHFPLAAIGLGTVTPEGVVLLDDVSFALEESSMLAVLGPSGAGKSTLLGALTGLRPATHGQVLCAGEDLYANLAHLSRRIGYVPQDDLVQPELTVAQSVSYAAQLRFAPDVTRAERDDRVREVLDELGLGHRADTRVGSLSGGQRKRVSIALELLTKPSLLFLDEPTSGLDPGYERSVMMVLRRLADDGRTIVLVTHSVESLHVCDRILCLAPGGRVAWYGPPQETTAFFGKPTYQEIFQVLDSHGAQDHAAAGEAPVAASDEWVERYAASDARRRYVDRPLSAHRDLPDRRQAEATPPIPTSRWIRQYATLTNRYAHIIRSDRRTLLILAVTGPVLGLVLLLRLPPGQLDAAGAESLPLFSQAPLVLFIVLMGITQVATSTSAREITKEREILRREKSVGLSMSAYVLSKVTVLGVLAALQATVIVGIATARQSGPVRGVLLGSGRLELVIVASVAAVGAMALGLLVSAVVRSPDRVALVLPAVLGFHLLVTSGEVMPASPRIPVIDQARVLSTARWGYTGMASTGDVEHLAVVNRAVGALPDLTAADLADEATLSDLTELAPVAPDEAHTREAWLRSVGAMLGITLVLVAATVVVLRRLDAS